MWPTRRSTAIRGIKTFMINQDGVVFEKDIGKDTANVAKTMAGFNPDNSWTALK